MLRKRFSTAALTILLATGASACANDEEGDDNVTGETTEQSIQEGANDAGNAVEEGASETGDAVQEGVDEAGETTEGAGEEMQQ